MTRHEARPDMSTLCLAGGHYVRLSLILLYLGSTYAWTEWVLKPENKSLALGQDLILSCLARSVNESGPSVTLSYQWYFNGSKVGEKASRFFNNSLFVPGLADADLGVYTCEVSRVISSAGVPVSIIDTANASSLVIKAYIEPFILQPSSVFASLNDTIVLTCVTGRSSPSLQVKWLRNGQDFLQGSQQVASFGDFDATGLSVQWSMKLTLITSQYVYGTFSCQAFNPLLSTTVSSEGANITYTNFPSGNISIIDWLLPSSLILTPGLNLILPCETKPSKEIPQITWYRDNSIFKSSSRVSKLSNNSLAFLPFVATDNGNYSCAAVNSAGEFYSPRITLTAAYLDVDFKEQPSDSFAFLGKNATLLCDPPNSIPPAEVVWYKDYRPLATSLSRVKVIRYDLHIVSVELLDRGVYYCVAVNNLSSPSTRTSATAKLTVQGPPIIRVPPMSIKIIKGKPLQLTCEVDAVPSPLTSWLFEGRNLTVNDKISLVEQGQTLWINDVGKEWEGQFTCMASNQNGKITADAYITVVVSPVSLQSIGDIVSTVGDSLDIPCYVVSDPMPSIVWLFNGVITGPANRSSNSFLHIDYVTPQHAGTYQCMGLNEAGNATSSGTLTVNVKPYLSVPLKNTTAVIGQFTTMTCEFKGQPTPSVNWFFNSSLPVPSNAMLRLNNSTLVVGPISWDNQGSYTCIGENAVGITQAVAYLSVQVAPQISSLSFPQSPVKLYSKFVLSCNATGIPPPLLQWVFQNQPIRTSTDGRVQVLGAGVIAVEFALKSDSGTYECWASSSAGQDYKQVTLAIYGVPSPAALEGALPVSSESVMLVWRWSSYGDIANRVDGFRIAFRERSRETTVTYPILFPGNQTSGLVSGLKPYTTYVFNVFAVNDAGVSDGSNPLTAVTNQSYPSTPANFLVSTVTASTAILKWELPIVSNGVVRLYQLRYKKEQSESDFVTLNVTATQSPSIEVTISALLPYTKYVAQLLATNMDNGRELRGNWTSSISFQTLPSPPVSHPQNVQADAVDPYSIKVTWQAISDNTGPILFYTIICQGNGVNRTTSVERSVLEAIIYGLRPWRQYTIGVYGVNGAGSGPMSPVGFVWTLALSPIAPPSDLKVTLYSSTRLKLLWKPLAVSLQTCNVTAYSLQYRIQGHRDWLDRTIPSSLDTSSSDFVGSTIESLQPWSWYEIRLACFCDNVTPAIGPFSYPMLAQTLQGTSGPVAIVNYTAGHDSVWLSWQPPTDPKGAVTGYELNLFVVGNTRAVKAIIGTESTSFKFEALNPETNYSISIGAVNEAGVGETSWIFVQTSSFLTTATTEVTEASTEYSTFSTYGVSNATGFPLPQQGDPPIKQNLAVIVAGSIVGAIASIVVTVFICIKCMQYRKKQRLNYVVDSEPEDTQSSGAYRPLEYPTLPPPPITSSLTITNASITKSPQVNVTQSAARPAGYTRTAAAAIPSQSDTTISPTHSLGAEDTTTSNTKTQHPSALAEIVVKEEAIHSEITLEKHKQKGHLSLPKISISHAYSKLKEDVPESKSQVGTSFENLGYAFSVLREENKTPSYLSLPGAAGVYFDTASISSDTLRQKSRMRSESAAAIAFMRSHQDVPIDDTDILVNNEIESEVIFNERTVL